jgi:hypothetical protein
MNNTLMNKKKFINLCKSKHFFQRKFDRKKLRL